MATVPISPSQGPQGIMSPRPDAPIDPRFQFAQPQQPMAPQAVDLDPQAIMDEGPKIITASDGTIITQMPDGSSIIGGVDPKVKAETDDFNENLAEILGIQICQSIAEDLLEGIEADVFTRREMVESYVKGIDLLGLKMKDRTGTMQRKNVSTVNHPVLLESIVKFQSGARAELLPAAGPVKVKVDIDSNDELDETAEALEQDLNHYLTTTATEYYPDTDRGLFRLGFGGTIFKKVYPCPLRNRPVSECVYYPDLIVSEEATDLENALRVTHKVMMNPGDVKRRMLAGYWVDTSLGTPSPAIDPIDKKVGSVEGITKVTTRAKDQQHTIYECYSEIDISAFDPSYKEKDAPEELPLPYRITMDKDARKILEIRRGWKDGDKQFKKKLPFVMYGLIPGMGFSCYGYLHLLGNQTKALTAIWRILIDSGIFSSAPAGVRVKGTRQTTNEINPGPGEWAEIDTGPMDDIRKALMPLPYKEPSPVFIQLSEIITQDAQRMAGAVEMEVGEGRSNVPVGTVMAMIEQQTQVMAAVHKRLHSAQAQEFKLLKELFAENPEALWKNNPNPKRKWAADEFTNLSVVPASDPNIPAQVHRIMQSTALMTLAAQNPDMYNKLEVHKRALRTIGISDFDELLNENAGQQGPQPDPKAMAHIADTQSKQAELQMKAQQIQAGLQKEAADNQSKQQNMMIEAQQRDADRKSEENIALLHLATERLKIQSKHIIEENKNVSQGGQETSS